MGTLVGLRMSLFGVAWTAFQVSARVLRNASEKVHARAALEAEIIRAHGDAHEFGDR